MSKPAVEITQSMTKLTHLRCAQLRRAGSIAILCPIFNRAARVSGNSREIGPFWCTQGRFSGTSCSKASSFLFTRCTSRGFAALFNGGTWLAVGRGERCHRNWTLSLPATVNSHNRKYWICQSLLRMFVICLPASADVRLANCVCSESRLCTSLQHAMPVQIGKSILF